jgi:NitT/TauT family transport system substrate-binding protein
MHSDPHRSARTGGALREARRGAGAPVSGGRAQPVRRALAALLGLCLVFAGMAGAQAQAPVKVRYTEVVRSILYAPSYVAISRGYFKDAGLDVSLATANGGDKAMSALLADVADIALIGPETTIYVRNSESPTKVKIFCGLTATDGFMLVGRKKLEPFDWQALKGKNILGFRPGSTPLLFFEAALRKKGLDPNRDVRLMNNVAIPARMGSWMAGQNEYGIFIEPDATQLEFEGKGAILASIGETVGFADYTAFMASEKYLREHADIVQRWTNAIAKAMSWTATAPTAELVKTLAEFFPGVNAQVLGAAAERYRRLHFWKTSPRIEPEAIERFQDVLVQGRVLEPGKRVKFDDLVTNDFVRQVK